MYSYRYRPIHFLIYFYIYVTHIHQKRLNPITKESESSISECLKEEEPRKAMSAASSSAPYLQTFVILLYIISHHQLLLHVRQHLHQRVHCLQAPVPQSINQSINP